MFWPVFFLALTFWLPGYGLWVAFSAELRERVSAVEAAYLIILSSSILLSWSGLLLAEFGRFSLAPLLGVAAVISLGSLGWALRHRRALNPFGTLSIKWPTAVALLALVIASLAYSRPFEYIVGGRDHGVYVNTGGHIARQGQILIQDDVLAQLPTAELRALLTWPETADYPGLPGPWSEGQRLGGLTIRDGAAGIVAPHAFHLYPIWIAIFYAFGGLELALWTTFVLALLGALGVYLAGARLFSPLVGLFTLVLLLSNVAQSWFTRYPTAEILLQYLFWAGLLAAVLMLTERSRYAAVLAGCAFGLTHLTKLDTVFIPLALAAFFVYRWLRGAWRPSDTYIFIPYAALALHAGLHAFLISTIYFIDHAVRTLLPGFLAGRLYAAAAGYTYPTVILGRFGQQNALLLGGSSAILVGLIVLTSRIRPQLQRVLAWVERMAPQIRAGGVLVLGGLGFYAFVGRPILLDISTGVTQPGWYLTPFVLLLGGIGFLQALVQRTRSADLFAQVMIFANVVPLAVLGRGTTPDHFWAIRRYVPIFFPAFLLFAGYALARLWPGRRRQWTAALLPIGATAVVWLLFVRQTLPLLETVDYAGLVSQVEALADQFPEDAILLFNDSDASNRLATPLWLLFGRPAFLVDPEGMAHAALGTAVAEWEAQNRPVYWLTTDGDTLPQQADVHVEYLETRLIETRLVEITLDRVPQRVGPFFIPLDIHALTHSSQALAGDAAEDDALVTIDVAAGTEDNWIQAGVYAVEPQPVGPPRRWTSDHVVFDVPLEQSPTEIMVRMGAQRPPDVAAPQVTLFLNGQSVATATAASAFDIYTFPVPDEMAVNAPLTLELEITPWVPAGTGHSSDERALGVQLDWLKIIAD